MLLQRLLAQVTGGRCPLRVGIGRWLKRRSAQRVTGSCAAEAGAPGTETPSWCSAYNCAVQQTQDRTLAQGTPRTWATQRSATRARASYHCTAGPLPASVSLGLSLSLFLDSCRCWMRLAACRRLPGAGGCTWPAGCTQPLQGGACYVSQRWLCRPSSGSAGASAGLRVC